MADLNNCSFTGRLTKDAERKTLPTGTNLISFDLACNTGWGDVKKTLFLSVNLWAKTGEGVFPYLLKGQFVAVTGELEVQEWNSKVDGSKQKKIVLNGRAPILLGGKRDDTGGGNKKAVLDSEGNVAIVEDDCF